MNFIKRNKKLLVVITVFLVALVAAIQLKNILYPSGGAIYGNRLDGIEEVKLAEDLDKQIQEKLKDFVSKVEVRTSGRIINITMIVNPDISSYGYSSSVVYTTGDYKIKDYNEWKIGIQGILYF